MMKEHDYKMIVFLSLILRRTSWKKMPSVTGICFINGIQQIFSKIDIGHAGNFKNCALTKVLLADLITYHLVMSLNASTLLLVVLSMLFLLPGGP